MAADVLPEVTNEGPSEALREGRRALEGMAGVVLLEDWTWHQQAAGWALKTRLSPSVVQNGPIPAATNWYSLVDDTYPWGGVIFYPAADGGITQTFPHQNCNAEAYTDRPWRKGRLCVDTNLHALGRQGYDVEPFEPGQRLRWHFSRVLEWLAAASGGILVHPGDPFELPQYPQALKGVAAFNESPESLRAWQDIRQRHGLVTLRLVNEGGEVVYASKFQTLDGRLLVQPQWGCVLSESKRNEIKGGWVLLDSIPVLEPCQAPTTWGELRAACRQQGISLDDHLRRIASRLRDGLEHILLLGAPIPATVGEPPRQLHWLALKLPALTSGKVRGFRSSEEGFWRKDQSMAFQDNRKVRWLDSENWSREELSGRGKLPGEVTEKHVVVLGAGAFGSAFTEQLVRAGTFDVTVLDGDTLKAGNLVRHNLGLGSVGINKAVSLASLVNNASPHAKVVGIPEAFTSSSEASLAKLREADVVIDCTARDEVLYQMGAFDWGKPKLFVSLSVGMWGKRLFVFSCTAELFPHDACMTAMRPWLEKELSEYEGTSLPREGTGCWHPVFPARIDDIWMMCSIAVKELQRLAVAPSEMPEFVVFEQEVANGAFVGVHRIAIEPIDG